MTWLESVTSNACLDLETLVVSGTITQYESVQLVDTGRPVMILRQQATDRKVE